MAVSAGATYTLGLKADGSIVRLGPYSAISDTSSLRLPDPNTGFVAVSAGYEHCLGLKADGSIVAWGANWYWADFDHIGTGACEVPAPNTGFVAVSAGFFLSLGLKADGSVVAWGSNSSGQCNVPEPNTGFVAIAAGGDHSLGLKSDGSVVAWGSNNIGQCNVPEPNTGFVAVAASYYYSVGLKGDCRRPIPIALGERVAGTARPNRFTDYRLDLEAGQARHLLVRVRPSGAEGSCVVRGRYGAPPTYFGYNWTGEASSTPGVIEMLIPSSAAGAYFFSIYPRQSVGDALAPFEIEVLAVEHYLNGVTVARGGNTGTTTFHVRGLGFEPGVRLELRDQGNTLRTAELTEILTDTLTAHLDLLGVAPGVYDVAVVWPSGAEETLPGAFEVVLGSGPRLEARIVGPAQVRPRRTYTLLVEYTNTGDSDMPAPLLYLSNTLGIKMTMPGTGRVSNSVLALLGIGAESPLGILPPGSSHRIPVTFVATSPGECRFELYGVQASDETVDWAALEPLLRPCSEEDEEWAAYWEQVTVGMGSTWAELLGSISKVLNTIEAPSLRLFDFGNVLANAYGELVAPSSPPTKLGGDIPKLWNPGTDVTVTPVGQFDPARERTYVVTHGWKSGKDDPPVAALWQALANGCGNSNVFVVDWRKGAAGTAWETGQRAASAGHAAAVKLHDFVVQNGGDSTFWNTVTYIGDTDGNSVNKTMSEDEGRVGKGLILDLPNLWGVDQLDLARTYSKSLSINTISLMDANPCSPLVRGDLANVQYLLAGVHATVEDPVLHGAALRALGERLKQSGGCEDPWLNLDLPAARKGSAGLDGLTYSDGSHVVGFVPRNGNPEIGWLGDSLARFVCSVLRPEDPNEKTGPLGTGSPETERFVQPGDELPYVVYFENKCSASAPAQEVSVTDYLDPDLDWSTFRLTEIAWGVDHRVTIPPDSTTFHSRETVPDHRPGVDKTWWVDVSVDINYSTGRVQWLFRTLDPDTGELPEDALAGFLPPNLIDGQCAPEDQQGPGEAHVAYTVKAKSSLAPGTRITNTASIVFDTEEPIVTNEVFNTILAFPVKVPQVVGITQWDAEAAIVAANLIVGTLIQQYSDTVVGGVVLGQEPASGTLPPGSAVDLVVSKGPRPVAVPSLIGKTLADAQAVIVAAGLTVGTVTEQYSAMPAGLVLGQNPAYGTLPSGSAVYLVVSKGPQPVGVPNVVGMTRTDAQAAIVAAGLTLGTVTEQYSAIAAGVVLSQEPASGDLPPGSAVSLVVATRTLADLDRSGKVDAPDVQLVINAALGRDIGSINADLNGDNRINATDVQLVINAVLGKK